MTTKYNLSILASDLTDLNQAMAASGVVAAPAPVILMCHGNSCPPPVSSTAVADSQLTIDDPAGNLVSTANIQAKMVLQFDSRHDADQWKATYATQLANKTVLGWPAP